MVVFGGSAKLLGVLFREGCAQGSGCHVQEKGEGDVIVF